MAKEQIQKQNEIKKAPKKTTSIDNPIYTYCESRGNEIIIRFDKDSKTSVAFCRFPDTRECPAESFYKGQCNPDNGAKYYETTITTTTADQIPIKNNNFVNCDSTYQPVCGNDNFTYTNPCLAQIQNISIQYDGPCKDAPVDNNSDEPTAPKNINNQNSGPMPGWLKIVKDFITNSPANNPPAFIEICNLGGSTYYYQSDGCDTCFSTLYDKDSKTICYPNNSALDCPSNFDPQKRTSCQRIWTDER